MSVPFLMISDRALMGVAQIAAELPGLIAAVLAAEGTDRPSPLAQDATDPAANTVWFTDPPFAARVGCHIGPWPGALTIGGATSHWRLHNKAIGAARRTAC